MLSADDEHKVADDDDVDDMIEAQAASDAPSLQPQKLAILFEGFNQDCSCLSVGTSSSYRIYQVHPFQKCFESHSFGARHVEMLFSTALVAIVGASDDPTFSPRRLRLINTKTEQLVCELSFTSSVLNVKLNNDRLVAIVEMKAHIFELKTMKLLVSVDTPSNPLGICDLSTSSHRCLLAVPARSDRGDVLVYDALGLHSLTVVQAHGSPIRALTFNADATLLATASEKGTVLRVFSVPSGDRLYTFRRGLNSANIACLSFNVSSSMMCSSSDSSTVHLFALNRSSTTRTNEAAASRESSSPRSSIVTSSSLLPNLLQNVVEPIRSILQIRVRDGSSSRPILCRFRDDEHIVVLSGQHRLYLYHVSISTGACSGSSASTTSSSSSGSFQLVAEASLVDEPSQALGVSVFENAPDQSPAGDKAAIQ